MTRATVCELDFRARVAAGETLVGTMVTLNSPQAAEILSAAGFDWLFIDTEHGAHGPLAVEALLQAAGDAMPCLVRIPVHEEAWIEKMLDVGAAGIIAPQVNTAAQAELVVQYGKYPPDGERGVGVARAQRYGARFAEYLERANDRLLTVIQIEHRDAIGNLAALAAVPGVDALFVGPYDLSMSYGVPGRVDDPRVRDGIAAVLDACRESGRAPGIFGIQADTVRRYVEQGFRLVCVGMDALFLDHAARAAREALR